MAEFALSKMPRVREGGLHRAKPDAKSVRRFRVYDLDDPSRLYRCHAIMDCTNVCPKGPTRPRRLVRSRI